MVSRRSLIRGAVAGAATAAVGPALPAAAEPGGPAHHLDDRMRSPQAWRDFLAGQDLVWHGVPGTFYEAPFLGNGGLGAALYRHPTRPRLQLTLGDSRVHDHQDVAGPVNNLGQPAEQSVAVWGHARLPIGYLTVETAGDVTAVDLRLSLWDAELTGTVTTTAGSVGVRVFVHATEDLLVAVLSPDAGEGTVSWSFTPLPALSPRAAHNAPPPGLVPNPDPLVRNGSDGGECVQDLAAGGQTATAWRTRTDPDGTVRLVATVVHSYPSATAVPAAVDVVDRAIEPAVTALAVAHQRWWHDFYPASFVSVPDARLQSFYWIQLYKMASATRVDRPVIGTCAAWLDPRTPWPATWWNLNVQLEYWLIHPTRHPELDSLSRSLDGYRDNLALNVPAAYRADSAAIGRTTQEDLHGAEVAVPGTISRAALPETGNLIWAMHDAWLAYRHTMDDARLRDFIYPVLRRAVNFPLHFLTEGADGRLHLPATFSPEYALAPDCNYDLALLAWGCRTLLDATARLGIDDPLRPRWQDVLDRLVAPPQGPDGMWIGAGVPLTASHRHYSHLLWFYPLHLLDVTDPTNRDLLQRSLAHWLGFTGALRGYSFTGGASMNAMLGNGDQALAYLNTLLDTFIHANTMYEEGAPVVETPLSAAQSVHDMLFTSWGGIIRIFPGAPSTWPDITVHNVATEGGFVISAVRRGGHTRFVRVRSGAGEPCRIMPALPGPYDVQPLSGHRRAIGWRDLGDGLLDLELDAGDDVVITTRGTDPELVIDPVPLAPAGPTWGLP
jgi:alpha-L-fucosidase 2